MQSESKRATRSATTTNNKMNDTTTMDSPVPSQHHLNSYSLPQSQQKQQHENEQQQTTLKATAPSPSSSDSSGHNNYIQNTTDYTTTSIAQNPTMSHALSQTATTSTTPTTTTTPIPTCDYTEPFHTGQISAQLDSYKHDPIEQWQLQMYLEDRTLPTFKRRLVQKNKIFTVVNRVLGSDKDEQESRVKLNKDAHTALVHMVEAYVVSLAAETGDRVLHQQRTDLDGDDLIDSMRCLGFSQPAIACCEHGLYMLRPQQQLQSNQQAGGVKRPKRNTSRQPATDDQHFVQLDQPS